MWTGTIRITPPGALALAALAIMTMATGTAAAAILHATAGHNPARATLTDISSAQGSVVVLRTPPRATPVVQVANVTRRASILYATDAGVRDIVGGSEQMRTLPWVFRQEPSNSGAGTMFGSGNRQRMSKVSGRTLATDSSGAAIASHLRDAINATCTTPAGISTCIAHEVAVDEIDSAFGSPVGGVPRLAGRHLMNAMATLAGQASPWGGSYASRVHFYLSPGVATSVTAGLGPNRTLGRDGLLHRLNYRPAFAGMARAGGVWLEMYHFTSGARMPSAFTATEWRGVPASVATFLRAVRPRRDPLTYLHFVMTETRGAHQAPGPSCAVPGPVPSAGTTGLPACGPLADTCPPSPTTSVPPGPVSDFTQAIAATRRREIASITAAADRSLAVVDAGVAEYVVRQPTPSAMACQWQRAQAISVNARILMNGPAAFRVTGSEAATWGILFRQFFIVA